MVELDIVNGGTPGSGADQPTRSLDSRGPDAVHELGERSSNNTNLKCEVLLSRMFPDAVDRPSLGRYDVLEFVGEGGMGTVYSAYDPRLDRKVAVKLVRNASSQPRRRTRLVREAKALARLSHSNVVTVHEVWDEGGELYIAMEFVEGHNLAQWQREPRSLREILDVYLQAARGLEAAHAAGLVHRDFKPSNVLVGHDGRVRVADFGLARLKSDASADEDSTPRAPSEPAQSSAVHDELAAKLGIDTSEAAQLRQRWLQQAYRRSELVAGFAAILANLDGHLEVSEVAQLDALIERLPAPAGRRGALAALRDAPPPLERIVGELTAMDPEERGIALLALVPLVQASAGGDRERALFVDVATKLAISSDEIERMLSR